MTTRILRNETDLESWVSLLSARAFPVTVSVVKGANRSGQQNRLAHKWYSQIGDEFGLSAIEVKAQCKARHGLPIMKRDNPEWVAKWEPMYAPLAYEMKLQLFEIIPLTSEFVVKQMIEFMDAVQRQYRAHGIELIDPEARRYEGTM